MARILGLVAAALLWAALPLRAEPVTQFTLANGLEVVVIEDHRAPAVVHMLWYRVGAADEPQGLSGIAHFLEHLMFKGTETRAAGEFSDVIEANGGSENAFTSWDYTGYWQRVAADRLGLMMEFEADRMANLRFSESDWLPERDVILEERGQVVESRPGSLLREEMLAAFYRNHPYGVPIIGWRHEMARLTGADAMDFYRRHYAPNNAVLIVAGDVTPDEVRALAETHYGPIPANPAIAPRLRPGEPEPLADVRLVLEDPRTAQPYAMRFYRAPSRRSGDQREAAALTVLAELLGANAATSVLGRALTIEDPVAIQATAFYDGVALDGSIFAVAVVPAPGVSLEDAEAAMDRELARFLEEGIDPAQLERVRTSIRASEIYALDDLSGRARRVGTAMMSGLTLEDVEAWPGLLQDVSEDEIMAAARAVLSERSVTGWLRAPQGQLEE